MHRKRKNIIQHLYNLIVKINVDMKTYCYLKMMKDIYRQYIMVRVTTHGYHKNIMDTNLINIHYIMEVKSLKKSLKYLHINMNHWILASLEVTNTHTLCILYDSKYDKVLCENTTLKMSKFLNIDHLNYICANVMQQLDQSSCGLFVIAYVVDIAFNLHIKKSRYVVYKMRQHLKNCLNAKYITSFPKI